ncbi:hypothetical protein BIZ83_gp062 [Erwinia phage vB_EamM_ChrisDB]|uniref:hypothetical protein n=1 Tax=Erwinia phage vB_EamM_ChrisDB TaxID=1883371 RepID=UPI00081CB055|nr:hypothetical protein BIZ83_gp062 [Erwinia phage vB_EamM_ChrisDB]ANZ48791.1 hypothetical protein CHRISDB_229 [Erwinia phage vB_EamM_ChrisDB]
MIKLISETLTMHSQTLMEAMKEYAYKTWVTNSAECGVGNAIPNFDHDAVSREGMAGVVARLILDALAATNARYDYIHHPEVELPQNPTPKYKAWRESGNAGMFTIMEMYDAHCRELKMSPLLNAAIKWFTTQFVDEMYRLGFADDRFPGWDNDSVVYVTWETLTQQLLDGRVILPVLSYTDYDWKAEAPSIDGIRKEIAETPYGFLFQNDSYVMYDYAARYILDPDDQDSDEDPGVELYALKPEVIEQLKNL